MKFLLHPQPSLIFSAFGVFLLSSDFVNGTSIRDSFQQTGWDYQDITKLKSEPMEGTLQPNETIAELARFLITQLYFVSDVNITGIGAGLPKDKTKLVHVLCQALQHWDPVKQGNCSYQPFGNICLFPTPAGEFFNSTCPIYARNDEHSQDYTPQILCDSDANWPTYEKVDDPHMLCLLSDTEWTDWRHRIYISGLVKQTHKYALIGYGISAVSCTAAIVIFTMFRRLHCGRNYIHCHLLVALLFHSLLYILKAVLFDAGDNKAGFPHYGKVLRSGTAAEKSLDEMFEYGHPWWECKLLVLLNNFALEATYFWLLIEGLYIHNAIFYSVFRETKVWLYAIAGWGCPALITVAFLIVRLKVDDYLCWNSFVNESLIWILLAPIELTLFVNSVLFIRLVRELFIKMRNSSTPDLDKHKKLAKSTFILILIFGLYHFVWIVLSFIFNLRKPDYTMVIFLMVDFFLGSLQGLFVAYVYCANNAEVRSEIRKGWKRFSIQHLNQSSRRWSTTPRHSLNTNSQTEQQNLSVASRKREKSASYTDIQLHLLQMPLSVSKPPEITQSHRMVASGSTESQFNLNNTGYTTLASSTISAAAAESNPKSGPHAYNGYINISKSTEDNEHLSSLLEPDKNAEGVHNTSSDNDSDNERDELLHSGD